MKIFGKSRFSPSSFSATFCFFFVFFSVAEIWNRSGLEATSELLKAISAHEDLIMQRLSELAERKKEILSSAKVIAKQRKGDDVRYARKKAATPFFKDDKGGVCCAILRVLCVCLFRCSLLFSFFFLYKKKNEVLSRFFPLFIFSL